MVEWKKIEDLGYYFGGLTGKTKEDFVDGNAKFVTYMNVFANPSLDITTTGVVKIDEGEKQNKIQKGDILFTGSSETPEEAGLSCVVTNELKEDYYMNSFCFGLRLTHPEQYDLGYLKHILRSNNIRKFISKSASGVTRFNISKARFSKILIPIPPLSEQQRIVNILDTFTSSIENLKEQIAQRRKQYEYYRDQLLDLEGKEIESRLSFGEDFQLKARVGWQGLTKKEYRTTGEYKLVTGTDFTSNLRIDFNNCVYVDKERYEQDDYIKLRVDDVLITKDGTLGKVAYIDVIDMPATLNGGVFVVRDLQKRVLPKFIMYYLTSYHFKKWMQQNHTTGSIQHLTQKLLSSFNIPVFKISEQQRIVSILDTFEASIHNLEQQLTLREKQYEYYRNKLLTFD